MEKGLLICRLCASSDKLINITEKDNLRSFAYTRLKNKIFHAIGIEVQNDDVFQKICIDCAETLNNYYIFKEKALKTNEILGEISTIIAADAPPKEVSLMVMRLTERSLSSTNEMEAESALKELVDSVDEARKLVPESSVHPEKDINSSCALQQFSVVNINEREEHDEDAIVVSNDNDIILIEDEEEEEEEDDPPFSHLIGEVLETPTKGLIVNDVSQEQFRNNITTFDLESDEFNSDNSNSVDSTETAVCSNESPNFISNLVVEVSKIFNKDISDKKGLSLENNKNVSDNECEYNNSDKIINDNEIQNEKTLQKENTDLNKVTSSSEAEAVLVTNTELVIDNQINITTSTEFSVGEAQNNTLLEFSRTSIEVAEVEGKDVLETDPVVITARVADGTTEFGKEINQSNKETEKYAERDVIRVKSAADGKPDNVVNERVEIESEEQNRAIEDQGAKTGTIENDYNKGNVLSLSNGLELPGQKSSEIESREEDMETEEQGVESEICAGLDNELENLMNAIDENTLIFEEIEKSIIKANKDEEKESEVSNNCKVSEASSSRPLTTSPKMRSKSKKLICHLCKTRFKTLRKLKIHLNITHPVREVDKTQCYMQMNGSTDRKSALLVDCFAARDWKYYVTPRVRLINACDLRNLNCLANFKGIKRLDMLNSQRYLKGSNTFYDSLADRIKRRNNISSVKEQSHKKIQITSNDFNLDVKRLSKKKRREHKRAKDRKRNSYIARPESTQNFLLDENSLPFNKFNITNDTFEAYMSKFNTECQIPYQIPEEDKIQGEIYNKSKQSGIDLFPRCAALSKYRIPKLIQNIGNSEIRKLPKNTIQENSPHDHNDGEQIKENKNNASTNISMLSKPVAVGQNIVNLEEGKLHKNVIQKNTLIDHSDGETIKENENNASENFRNLSKTVFVGQNIINPKNRKTYLNEIQKNTCVDHNDGKKIEEDKNNSSANTPMLSKTVHVGQNIESSKESKVNENEMQKNLGIRVSDGEKIKEDKNSGSENIPNLSKTVFVGQNIIYPKKRKIYINEIQNNTHIYHNDEKKIEEDKNSSSANIPILSKTVHVGQNILNSKESKLHKNEIQKNTLTAVSDAEKIQENQNISIANIPMLSKMDHIDQNFLNSDESKLHKNEIQKNMRNGVSDGSKNNGSENILNLSKTVFVSQNIIIPKKRKVYINEIQKNTHIDHNDGKKVDEDNNNCSANIPMLSKTVSVCQNIESSEESKLYNDEEKIKKNKNNGSENIPNLSKTVFVGQDIIHPKKRKVCINDIQKNTRIDHNDGMKNEEDKNSSSANIPMLSKMVPVDQIIVNSDESKLNNDGKKIKENKNNGNVNIPNLSKTVFVSQDIINPKKRKVCINEIQKNTHIDHNDEKKIEVDKNSSSANIPMLSKMVPVDQIIVNSAESKFHKNEIQKNTRGGVSDGEKIPENKNNGSENIPQLLKTVAAGQNIGNFDSSNLHKDANHRTTPIDHNEGTKVEENKIKTGIYVSKSLFPEKKSSVPNNLYDLSNGSNGKEVQKNIQEHLKNSLEIMNTKKDTSSMENNLKSRNNKVKLSKSILDALYKKEIENDQANRIAAAAEDVSSRTKIDNAQSGSSEYCPPRVLYAESYERLKFPAIKHGEPIAANKTSSVNAAIQQNAAPIHVYRYEAKKQQNIKRTISETIDLTNSESPVLSTSSKHQNSKRLLKDNIIENNNINHRETVIRVGNQTTVQSLPTVNHIQGQVIIRKVPMQNKPTGETKSKNISIQSTERVLPSLIPLPNQNSKINRLNNCNINKGRILPKLQPCPQLTNKTNQDNIRNDILVLPTLQPCPKSILKKSTSYECNEKIDHSMTRNIGSAGSHLTEKNTANINSTHTPTPLLLQPNVKLPAKLNCKLNKVIPNQLNQNSNGLIKESTPHEVTNRQIDQSSTRTVVSEKETTKLTYVKQVTRNFKIMPKPNSNIQNNSKVLCSNSSGITTESKVQHNSQIAQSVSSSSQSENLHTSEIKATTMPNSNQLLMNYYQFQGQNRNFTFVPSLPQTLNEQGPRFAYILNTPSTFSYHNPTSSVSDNHNRTMAAETLLGLSKCFIAPAPSFPNGNSNPLVIPQGFITIPNNSSQITGLGKPDTNLLNSEKIKTLQKKRIDDTNAAVFLASQAPTSELPNKYSPSYNTAFEQYVNQKQEPTREPKRGLHGSNTNQEQQAKKRKLEDTTDSSNNKTEKHIVGNIVNRVTLPDPSGNEQNLTQNK